MRIISFNANGIRAAARKGFYEWLKQQDADIVCLQETKAQMVHLQDEHFRPQGYHCYFHDAQKPGYSGVGIYSKQKPQKISTGLGWDYADTEGRYIQADFPDFSVASLYLPSGSSGEARQTVKFDFLERYLEVLREIKRTNRSFIICGDWNIVHKEIDIKNFKSNQKSSGCLPEERAWMDGLLTKEGFVDAFRVVDQRAEQYTWWSNRANARANNVGWRIDYQIVTPDLAKRVKSAFIYKDEFFSDHAPLVVDYT